MSSFERRKSRSSFERLYEGCYETWWADEMFGPNFVAAPYIPKDFDEPVPRAEEELAMSIGHLRKVIATVGEGAILETRRVSDRVHVAVIDRETLQVTDRFTISGYPRVPAHKVAVVRPKWSPSRYKRSFHIPESNARNWVIDPNNILLSRTEFDDKKIVRISWHPLDGEMILSSGDTMHAHDIHNHGSHPFDEYIRAIVLPEKRKVTARPWFPFGAEETRYLLGSEAKEISHAGQDALRQTLERAGMPKSWYFEYNVSNPRLEQLTGRRGW